MNKYIPTIASFLIIITILYFLFNIMKPFFAMIFIAFVISIFMNPVFNYFRKKQKKGKILSATITIALFVLFIFLPVVLFSLLVFNEVKNLIHFLQMQDVRQIETFIKSTLQQYGIPYTQIQIDIKEIALQFLSVISHNATTIITRTGTFLGNAAFTLLLSYYLLVEKEHIFSFFKSVNPLESHHSQQLYKHATAIINRTIKGNIILMSLQCVIGIVGLTLFGSIAPTVLGILYGVFSIIPTLGAIVIWLPITIYLFFYQGLIFAIGFLLWSILTSFLVEEYITPKLVNEETKVHPLLILMSVVGAVEQFGLIGMLVGPTIVTLSFAALQIYKEIVSQKALK